MSKLYNLKQLEDLSDGNKEFILEIVTLFILEIPSLIESIEKALEENNIEALSKISHKIKPSIDLFGIKSITKDIRILEASNDIKSNKLELNKLLDNIKVDINKTINDLKFDFNI